MSVTTRGQIIVTSIARSSATTRYHGLSASKKSQRAIMSQHRRDFPLCHSPGPHLVDETESFAGSFGVDL